MLLAAVLALGGCGDDNTGGGGSGTTPTELGGPEATATPTPLASAGVVLTLTNGGAATQQAMVSGTRLSVRAHSEPRVRWFEDAGGWR